MDETQLSKATDFQNLIKDPNWGGSIIEKPLEMSTEGKTAELSDKGTHPAPP